MVSTFWCLLFLVGVITVFSYPMGGDGLYEDGYFLYPEDSDVLPSYPIQNSINYISKRSHLAQKRATLDQLLQRLVAMYGNRDIQYSGRPSHVRFALGGRKR